MPVPSLKELYASGPAVLRGRWYLRSAERLGTRVRVWGSPVIHNTGRLLIGDHNRPVWTPVIRKPEGEVVRGRRERKEDYLRADRCDVW